MPNLSLLKTWDYLATSTLERISPYIADNATGRIFLLHVLEENGMKSSVMGGRQLVFPVFKELSTATAYTDLDLLTVARANPTTPAIYNWKQLAVPIQVSGRDMLINSGSDVAVSNLLVTFAETAIASLREGLDDATNGIHSSNDETVAGVTGLQNLLTHTANATPTSGTAGNLDRAVYTFWRNQVSDVANAFGTSSGGYAAMHALWTLCTRGDEVPDIIELTRLTFNNYVRNATTTIRLNTPLTSPGGVLDIGFGSVTFQTAIVGFDDYIPPDFGYFLCSKYVHWVTHPQRDVEVGSFVMTPTLDALSAHVFWAGNLCFSNMARHGVLRRGDTN